MKQRKIWSWAFTLALAAGLVSFSQSLRAQTQNHYPSQAQQSPSAQKSARGKTHTYTGKIVKTKTGKYALLTDPQKGKGFFLDNQQEAQKFNQKNVKVVATLDPHTMMLHVIDIKPAS